MVKYYKNVKNPMGMINEKGNNLNSISSEKILNQVEKKNDSIKKMYKIKNSNIKKFEEFIKTKK